MTTKAFEFNTGRHYAADGQRIKCVYGWCERVSAHVIAFNDVSRGIAGWFPYNGRTDDTRGLQEVVMAAYDSHAHSGSPLRFDLT